MIVQMGEMIVICTMIRYKGLFQNILLKIINIFNLNKDMMVTKDPCSQDPNRLQLLGLYYFVVVDFLITFCFCTNSIIDLLIRFSSKDKSIR